MIHLSVVAASPQLYQEQYLEWCRHHFGHHVGVPYSPHGVWVQARNALWGGMVSACFFYPAGPYFYVDGFTVNPKAPPRMRLKAMELTIEQVLSYSSATGMVPKMLVRSGSILRRLKLAGFEVDPGVGVVRHSRSMSGEMAEPERKPKPKTRVRKKAKTNAGSR